MPSAPTTRQLVSRIAALGLSEDGEVLRVTPEAWPSVLSRLHLQRLTGIAVAATEEGRLVLETDQVGELLDHHRSAMLLALAIEQQLLHLAESFQRSQIRSVVLKGSAVAHGIYPDPTMRPFGDLDLLVATKDWRSACRILRDDGYVRKLPEPRRGFDERFGKAATHSNAAGIVVDLHRTLVLGPFGLWLDPDELLRHTDTFCLAGRAVERLDPTGVMLNVALHAALGASPPLLLPLRDVVQAAWDPEVDWELLASWGSEWHLTAPLRYAFTVASEELRVGLPSGASRVASAAVRSSESRALNVYIERRRSGRIALAATRAIPGVRAKATYLFGLLLPSREFLRARAEGRTPASYLSRWGIPMRWITQRRRHAQGHRRLGVAHDR